MSNLATMIRYYFSCDKGHTFDIWFKSIAFFEEQYNNPGAIVCTICSSTNISKKIMAPFIIKNNSKSNKKSTNNIVTDVEKINEKLNNFKKYVKNNFTYVGKDFKEVAIKMHKGELKKDNIYGEANTTEIEELNAEGVEVLAFETKVDSKKIN